MEMFRRLLIVTVLVFIFDVTFFGYFVHADCDETFKGYEEYLQDWKLRNVTLSHNTYPYGPRYCDKVAAWDQKILGFDPDMPFDFVFYGIKYRSAWISAFGHISFNFSTTHSLSPYIYLDEWPNPKFPDSPDPPYVGPFYSEADFYPDFPNDPNEPSQLYYRFLVPGEGSPDLQYITKGIIDDLSIQIRASVIGAGTFQATRGMIVTWHKVTFSGADCQATPTDTCRRNTFQVILLTDGMHSFSMFNYYNITWVGANGKQRCDPVLGIRTGSYPNCEPAHAGFNAGFGLGFTPLPFTNEDRVADLDVESGTNVTGRYIYKISDNVIYRGGCSNNTISSPKWPLTVYPSFAEMFGGEAIAISGPCFPNSDRIKCRFGDVTVDGLFDGNPMRAYCVTPLMNRIGMIKLEVSGDGGNSYQYSADFTIGLSGRNPPKVTILNSDYDWLDPPQITLTWNPLDIAPSESSQVDVKLFGYREHRPSQGADWDFEWKELQTIAKNYGNTGSLNFEPALHRCSGFDVPQKCRDFDIGVLAVSISSDLFPGPHPRRVWSEVIPLGWYNHVSLEDEHGKDWASEKCQLWLYADQRYGGWQDKGNIQPCPCTLKQSYADFGRFEADVSCDQNDPNPNKCRRHRGAKHCVRSVHVTHADGSGSHCCYDDRGYLMYSGDNIYGSTSDRSHDWGKHPYGNAPFMPTMSHWIRDVIPWYYCCQWQTDSDEDCFTKLMVQRPTSDCANYQLSGHATAFGDPHFRTMDGNFYTFNGHGEFWLMKLDNLEISGHVVSFYLQGRMQQPIPKDFGETKATYLTAIAMNVTGSPIVTISINEYDSARRHMLVHVGGTLLDFYGHDMHWQEFKDFIIKDNDPEMHSGNFTVIFRDGFGVQAAWSNELMQVMVSLPSEAYGETRGLLGLWNGEPGDDLQPRIPGSGAVQPGDTRLVHYQFGLTWIATSTETLFRNLYRARMNYDYYRKNDSFVPNWDPTFPPGHNISDGEVNAVCNGDKGCTYDYKATLNVHMARATLDIQRWDQQVRDMTKIEPTCGWLPIPYAIKQEPIDYHLGAVVTIIGCRGDYMLNGATSYTCMSGEGEDMYWDPQVSTTCVAPPDGLGPAIMTAIIIPSIFVFCLLIIGLVVLILCCRKRIKKGKPTRKSTEDLDFFEGNMVFGNTGPIPPKHVPADPISKNVFEKDVSNDSSVIKGKHRKTPTPPPVNLDDSISFDGQGVGQVVAPPSPTIDTTDKKKKKKKKDKEFSNSVFGTTSTMHPNATSTLQSGSSGDTQPVKPRPQLGSRNNLNISYDNEVPPRLGQYDDTVPPRPTQYDSTLPPRPAPYQYPNNHPYQYQGSLKFQQPYTSQNFQQPISSNSSAKSTPKGTPRMSDRQYNSSVDLNTNPSPHARRKPPYSYPKPKLSRYATSEI